MKRLLIIILISMIILGVGTVSVILTKSKVAKLGAKNQYFKEAESVLLSGNYIEAKKLYKQAQDAINDVDELREIQKKIETINIKIIFSPIVDNCSIKYTVKPNDSLTKIAKEYNTTIELIKRSNNLSSDTIRPGQEFKINTCKFSMVVDKSQNLLFLKTGDEIVKTYVVSTGKNNSSPVGSFKVVLKQVNPTWFKTGAVIPPDSPENILGTRWIGLDIKGYGIHGTIKPENLGKQVTLGCVRMRNGEVKELYDIVPVGTEVIIVD